jgi:AcrR family transcriptional regulator
MATAAIEARTDARVTKTLVRLRKAFRDLIAEVGFETITVADITARANVGYATYYRHYPDKQALLADVFADLVEDIDARLRPLLSADDTLGAARALCDYVEANRTVCHALSAPDVSNYIRETLLGRWAAAPRREAKSADWLPPDLRVVYSVTSIMAILAWWMRSGPEVPVEAMAGIIDRLVIGAVR